MHYYKFNIADYRADTGHLSTLEHGIYRQLIDWYYLDAKPIPLETQVVMRRLRLGLEHEQLLLNVLQDFFVKTENGYTQTRIERELSEYAEQVDKNRANGKQGGRPRKTNMEPTNNPSGFQTKPKHNPNHKPLTINHEPDSKESKPSATTAQGTRLPADMLLESEYIKAAMDIRQDWGYPKINAVFAEFKDYWLAQAGAKGRKADWLATWRNWCRREKGFTGHPNRRAAVADQIMGGINGRVNTINDIATTRPVASCREDISAPAIVVWESDNGEMGRD